MRCRSDYPLKEDDAGRDLRSVKGMVIAMEENKNLIQPEDDRIYSEGEEPEKSLSELEAELKAKREKKIESFKIDLSASGSPENDIDFFPDAAGQDPSAAAEEELYSCSKEFRSQK